ncbi:solute carrier family 25 protein [Myriangium duriaei CBS 260.36]|uniref:Solute carrier family 25 protein n=1 Tax=Myriangium duriaei CBS 260.36 TaxID=1168546 RepID=A0A9P4J9L7_9PEZI|nr:solute carrier family 25 protein [Myriangium duriaei CBS 260.36]
MSADFWAGYLSGAAGIIIGNPLDLIKTRLQAGQSRAPSAQDVAPPSSRLGSLVKGSAAPVLGYGALNALLFTTYNRAMLAMNEDPAAPHSLGKTWTAGAAAGLATFVVSAPTELIKCRVQVNRAHVSSLRAARDIWRHDGLRGLYWGGTVTALRDSVGYGFYYWSYELSKRALMTSRGAGEQPEWMSVLLCGGIAGVATWASIFPLDVIKTRVQTQGLNLFPTAVAAEPTPLIQRPEHRLNTWQIARKAYTEEGLRCFFRGLGVCSVRAFFVNAVQWAVYEWTMHFLMIPETKPARIIEVL